MTRRSNMLVALAAAVLMTLGAAGAANAASSPTVATSPATSVSSTSEVLKAVVRPNGATTSYRFEYGLTPSFGLGTTVRTLNTTTGSPAVSETVKGLLPGTTYYFRIDATNKYGSAASSARKFKTTGNPPPGVTTGPAAVRSSTSATVSGVVNPNGQATEYEFQYGPSNLPVTQYSQTLPQTVPAGSAPVTVSATINGLTPGTSFNYRIVALHKNTPPQGGAFQMFLTFPTRRPVPRLTATTTPRRERHQPYVFVTAGMLRIPAALPRSIVCTGNVAVRFKLGRKLVGFQLAPVSSRCTYRARTALGRAPSGRHRLTVLVHYRSNGYLAPANTRVQHVTIG